MDDAAATVEDVRVQETALPLPLHRVFIATARIIVICTLIEAIVPKRVDITSFFFLNDAPVLIALAAILAAAALWQPPAWFGSWAAAAPHRRSAALLLALAAGVVALAGTALVFGNHPLSYDEVMAVFDAEIFRTGRLIAPLPPEWRAFRDALAPSFLLQVPGDAAWVSAYLPVNALLRAAVGTLVSPSLTGPILLVVAVLALNAVARCLWPKRPDATLVAILLLVSAPQVLFTAMTPYAMTAHLALNLVWLSLFLRGGVFGHAGAAVTGFLACGLHQLVFHPLFAAPFLAGLAADRRWRLAVFYGAVYAASATAWILYGQGMLWATGHVGEGDAAIGTGGFFQHVSRLLAAFRPDGLDLMAKNLLRFVAWQSPLLLPLAAVAWPAIHRGEGIARPLAAGIALTVLAMTVLLPFQGHGWGYRYLHGLIGSACLLAAQGWIAATARIDALRLGAARAAVGFSCALAVLVSLPLETAQIHRFTAPFAAASRAITDADADIVAVTEAGVPYARDLVRNDPLLGNRPIVVLLDGLDAAARVSLCARGKIAAFGPAEAKRLGISGPNLDDKAPSLPCVARSVRLPLP